MRRDGFTLVELVLVITLTFVLTAAAIAGLHGVQSWRASAGVRRIQSDIMYARNLALLSARRTLCVFDSQSTSYEIQQESSPGSGPLVASVIDHPLTDDPWQVTVQDLASGLAITSSLALDPPVFGFGSDGVLVDSSGSFISKDLEVAFNNGAKLAIYSGSGLCEVRWP